MIHVLVFASLGAMLAWHVGVGHVTETATLVVVMGVYALVTHERVPRLSRTRDHARTRDPVTSARALTRVAGPLLGLLHGMMLARYGPAEVHLFGFLAALASGFALLVHAQHDAQRARHPPMRHAPPRGRRPIHRLVKDAPLANARLRVEADATTGALHARLTQPVDATRPPADAPAARPAQVSAGTHRSEWRRTDATTWECHSLTARALAAHLRASATDPWTLSEDETARSVDLHHTPSDEPALHRLEQALGAAPAGALPQIRRRADAPTLGLAVAVTALAALPLHDGHTLAAAPGVVLAATLAVLLAHTDPPGAARHEPRIVRWSQQTAALLALSLASLVLVFSPDPDAAPRIALEAGALAAAAAAWLCTEVAAHRRHPPRHRLARAPDGHRHLLHDNDARAALVLEQTGAGPRVTLSLAPDTAWTTSRDGPNPDLPPLTVAHDAATTAWRRIDPHTARAPDPARLVGALARRRSLELQVTNDQTREVHRFECTRADARVLAHLIRTPVADAPHTTA